MSASKLLRVAGLTLILLLTLVGQGQAQGQQPPRPPHSSLPPQPPSFPPLNPPVTDGLKAGGRIPAQAATESSAKALSLGAPGLSFQYVQTFGETEIPYISDTNHLNFPWGIATDGTNVLIGEYWGHRVLKYTSSGDYISTIGTAGTAYNNGDPWGVFDMAVDGSGQTWIVDNDTSLVTKFDASNNYLGKFNEGMFEHPAGIAFDAAGNVYISDGAAFWNDDIGNHRVLVFDSAGNLLSTIGTMGETGTDNNHFFGPQHIAIYGNMLYVADGGNDRIQIFDITNPAAPIYSATIGVTGESGSDNTHFDHPVGVAVNSAYIFVADRRNNRVQVFARAARTYATTIGTGWGTDNDQFENPTDVAVDSAGNLYVADFVNCRVQQFNSSFVYQRTYGVTGVPYLTDNNHYNSPSGVAIAPDGSMYITEDNGQRLIKRNANGSVAWAVGAAGVKGDWDNANDRLDNPADIALNATGLVYVADRWHGRVQVYNPDGTYNSTLGSGTGNYEFSCPTGLTIDKNGYIYVTDCWRQRVQIFDAQHTYVATLGVTDVSGSDNAHFSNPQGVAVDGNGFIYVADSDNQRVQVFNASRVYVRALGVTGESGRDFAHFSNPQRLAVDSSNRLYVSDSGNDRVQVFDSTGAYLTTIGGAWGNLSGMLRDPQGLGFDQNGAVYVADHDNHRIQKFALGTPGWRQTNINGFGDPANVGAGQEALNTFGGQLYAGTTSNGTIPAQVWRTSDGQTWSQFSPGWALANDQVTASQQFGAYFYVGSDNVGGSEIWRTDGSTWTQVVSGGFGDTNNYAISSFAVFANQLYAVTMPGDGILHIYRSSSGDPGSWSPVVSDGFGNNGVSGDTSIYVYGGYLYVGLNRNNVAELWRTDDGMNWNPVFTNGLATNNSNVSSIANFGDTLYIGLRNVVNGGEVWRSTDGTNFSPVFTGGLGNPDDKRPYGMYVFSGRLYLLMTNTVTGDEVWRTANGTNWEQVGFGGWGDANNIYSDYYGKGAAVFNNSLFFGTGNSGNGGEIWQLLNRIYLPLVIR